jgi:hypothetical protein
MKNNNLTTRRETADVWKNKNPILDDMELGVEIVLKSDRTVSHYNIKLGDGITHWNNLSYFYENISGEETNEILDDFTINLATKKPVANRIPIYDENKGIKSGKIPDEDDDVMRLLEFNRTINEIILAIKNKANIYVRQAQGITIGNNIQGMHIKITDPVAYVSDWSFITSDGQSFVRTDNNFSYFDSENVETKIVENGVVLIPDYTIANPFFIDQITGSYSNPEFFFRYFDIKDLDQRIGLVSALLTADKSSVVNAINSLKGYVDDIVNSTEVSGSPYSSYDDFLAGAGAEITQGAYAYVTFNSADTPWPANGNWSKVAADDTWRLDCSDTAWTPTVNMTTQIIADIKDEAGTGVLKEEGKDFIESWIQSYRNNLKYSLDANKTVLPVGGYYSSSSQLTEGYVIRTNYTGVTSSRFFTLVIKGNPYTNTYQLNIPDTLHTELSFSWVGSPGDAYYGVVQKDFGCPVYGIKIFVEGGKLCVFVPRGYFPNCSSIAQKSLSCVFDLYLNGTKVNKNIASVTLENMPTDNVTGVFSCVPLGDNHETSTGRNILGLLGVATIPEASAILRRLCNNNGEISSDKIDYFSIFRLGDYIDGIDLSGIESPENGIIFNAPEAWNNTYKNNRIVIAGFNTYKECGIGSAGENKKNYIKFAFRDIVFNAKFHSSTPLDGGYLASDLRAYLEGASGDGTGPFAVKLKEQLGGEYLMRENTIRVYDGVVHNTDSLLSVYLPFEYELFGYTARGEGPGSASSGRQWDTVHLPLYRANMYRVKKWHGSRAYYRSADVSSSYPKDSCVCIDAGATLSLDPINYTVGVSPVFNFC